MRLRGEACIDGGIARGDESAADRGHHLGRDVVGAQLDSVDHEPDVRDALMSNERRIWIELHAGHDLVEAPRQVAIA
jgi:hypothetical protein